MNEKTVSDERLGPVRGGDPYNSEHVEYAVRCDGKHVFGNSLKRTSMVTLAEWADANHDDSRCQIPHAVIARLVTGWQDATDHRGHESEHINSDQHPPVCLDCSTDDLEVVWFTYDEAVAS